MCCRARWVGGRTIMLSGGWSGVRRGAGVRSKRTSAAGGGVDGIDRSWYISWEIAAVAWGFDRGLGWSEVVISYLYDGLWAEVMPQEGQGCLTVTALVLAFCLYAPCIEDTNILDYRHGRLSSTRTKARETFLTMNPGGTRTQEQEERQFAIRRNANKRAISRPRASSLLARAPLSRPRLGQESWDEAPRERFRCAVANNSLYSYRGF